MKINVIVTNGEYINLKHALSNIFAIKKSEDEKIAFLLLSDDNDVLNHFQKLNLLDEYGFEAINDLEPIKFNEIYDQDDFYNTVLRLSSSFAKDCLDFKADESVEVEIFYDDKIKNLDNPINFININTQCYLEEMDYEINMAPFFTDELSRKNLFYFAGWKKHIQ